MSLTNIVSEFGLLMRAAANKAGIGLKDASIKTGEIRPISWQIWSFKILATHLYFQAV